MEITTANTPQTKRKRGQQLTVATRNVLIAKMLDAVSEGLVSTNSLAKRLGVDRSTIDAYRPLVDEIMGRDKIDRNIIRNLQIRRTYKLVEMLMEDLKGCATTKEKSMIYGNIFKFSSHLALICGLNVETQVNVDQKQLVIIRSARKEKKDNYIEVTTVDELPQIEV